VVCCPKPGRFVALFLRAKQRLTEIFFPWNCGSWFSSGFLKTIFSSRRGYAVHGYPMYSHEALQEWGIHGLINDGCCDCAVRSAGNPPALLRNASTSRLLMHVLQPLDAPRVGMPPDHDLKTWPHTATQSIFLLQLVERERFSSSPFVARRSAVPSICSLTLDGAKNARASGHHCPILYLYC
jgi:hypothetical protein